MTEVLKAIEELTREVKELRAAIGIYQAPTVSEYYRQLLTAPPAVVKDHNKRLLSSARKERKQCQ